MAESFSQADENIKIQTSLSRPLFSNGRYANPWPTWRWVKPWILLKWIFRIDGDDRNIPNSKEELDLKLPIESINAEDFRNEPTGIRITWIGHATVLFQFDGVTVLTDPVFSERIGPPYAKLVKRYRHAPCSVEELPKIDAVVISHDHYDHLDTDTVYQLNKRFGKDLSWFVPEGLANWMRECGIEVVTELSWWDSARIVGNDSIRFVCTPAQHWCGRALIRNKVLWCSWTIIGVKHRVFFSGDTGYCSAFKEIGEMFGPIDLAALPIGAYLPRSMMEPQHVDPEQAVFIHRDIQAKKSIGMHWGTFALGREFYLEGPVKFAESAKESGFDAEDCFVLKHGEVREIEFDN